MSSSEPESVKTKTIQDVLKGSYWEKFTDDVGFISAVHHYYAVVQKYYSEPFYHESVAKLQTECKRLDAGKSSDGLDVTRVPVTPLFEIIAKAAVNQRDTTIIFPDGKTGDELYRDYIMRTVKNPTEADLAVPPLKQVKFTPEITGAGSWIR